MKFGKEISTMSFRRMVRDIVYTRIHDKNKAMNVLMEWSWCNVDLALSMLYVNRLIFLDFPENFIDDPAENMHEISNGKQISPELSKALDVISLTPLSPRIYGSDIAKHSNSDTLKFYLENHGFTSKAIDEKLQKFDNEMIVFRDGPFAIWEYYDASMISKEAAYSMIDAYYDGVPIDDIMLCLPMSEICSSDSSRISQRKNVNCELDLRSIQDK